MGDLRKYATCILFLVLPVIVYSAPEIVLGVGRIQGVDKQAEETLNPYYAYYGIPFAEPPTGNLRFRQPVPYRGSNPNNVISSNTFRPTCLQYPVINIDEDCLFLNIFTPQGDFSTGTPKKVMVWIFGGAFLFGDSAAYIPSRMVTDNDVIVVTLNYRLSVFGFLSAGRGDGNYGMYDQLLALRWVKDHISKFGGDPNDVTIFGESAGSASVSLLSLSPLGKGLFEKGIMQSGVGNAVWSVKRDPKTQFEYIAESVGCLPWFYWSGMLEYSYDSIIECLRKADAEDIGGAAITYSFGSGDDAEPKLVDFNLEKVGFLPVVDGDFLPNAPKILLADKAYLQDNGVLDRKYIVGMTNNEALGDFEGFALAPGADLLNVDKVESAERYVDSVVEITFPYFSPPKTVSSVIKYEYTYPRTSDDRVADLQTFLNVGSDLQMLVPMVEFVRAISTASSSTDIFLYLFDHYPEVLNPEFGIRGTTHAMELIYEFDFTSMYPILQDSINWYAKVPSTDGSDRPLAGVFRGVLTQFAKTGNPSRGVSGPPSIWPRYDTDDESYMALSTSPRAGKKLHAKRVDMWLSLIPELEAQSRRRF